MISFYLAIYILTHIRARIAGIMGSRGAYPCPICLVPTNEQFDLSKSWPARSRDATEALLTEASQPKTKKARKDILDTQSLRFLHVSDSYSSRISRDYII